MNKDRWRMQERIKELKVEMTKIIMKSIPEDGNMSDTKIQKCQLELKDQKSEMVALTRALNFLSQADNTEHHERASKM